MAWRIRFIADADIIRRKDEFDDGVHWDRVHWIDEGGGEGVEVSLQIESVGGVLIDLVIVGLDGDGDGFGLGGAK